MHFFAVVGRKEVEFRDKEFIAWRSVVKMRAHASHETFEKIIKSKTVFINFTYCEICQCVGNLNWLNFCLDQNIFIVCCLCSMRAKSLPVSQMRHNSNLQM